MSGFPFSSKRPCQKNTRCENIVVKQEVKKKKPWCWGVNRDVILSYPPSLSELIHTVEIFTPPSFHPPPTPDSSRGCAAQRLRMSLMFYLRKAAPLSHKSPRTALFCFTPRWARPSALASPAAKALNLCSACPLWLGQTSIWRKLWSGVTHTLSEGEARGGACDVSCMLCPINSLFCEYIKANWGHVLLCSDGMALLRVWNCAGTGDAKPIASLMPRLASDGSMTAFAFFFLSCCFFFFLKHLSDGVTPAAARARQGQQRSDICWESITRRIAQR